MLGNVTLDPTRPLFLYQAAERLTIAVVSVAWLYGQRDTARKRIESVHLTLDEQRYAATLSMRKRRSEWLAGRIAIKHGVRYYRHRYGSSVPSICDLEVSAIRHGPQNGKPVVNVPLEIGLSHSGEFAIAACGPHAIGIDLEHERTMPPPLSKLLTHDDDRSQGLPGRLHLESMPLPLRWACREAILKYYGFGLRIDPGDINLTGWQPDGAFSWRAGPGLLRHAPAANEDLLTNRAYTVSNYFLALVWQKWRD